MKKKYLLSLIIAGLGLTLASCGASGSVALDYDESDLDIDTPWVDYSVPVTKVTFAEGEESITINKGETHTYDYEVEPKKATKSSLSWSSANEEVATVEKGVVSAIGGGETTVTVYNEVGSFTPKQLSVKVEVPLKDFSIEEPAFEADFEHTYQLVVDYDPVDTTQMDVTWSSSDGTIATVDQSGRFTTLAKTGSVTISASSAYIDKVASVTIDVADRTIYPVSASIDTYAEKVEIGHDFTITAHSVGAGEAQVTHPEMTYYSTDNEVLAVEEETGVAHALKEGTAQIYAKASNGVESDKVTVTVFEVKVQSIQLEDIVLSNRHGMSDIQVEFSYTTDNPEFTVASVPHFVYETGNENVATVNDNGKLFAVNVGTTTITVTDTRSGKSATAALEVKYEVDTVNVSGTSTILIGETTKLSVSTVPGGVPSEYVSFSSSDETIASVDAEGVVTAQGVGTAIITATVLGKTGTFNVTVEEPKVPFVEGQFYVVGNRNYASGTSSESTLGSWDEAKEAYHFTDKVQDAHDTLLYEYRAIITFAKDDVWKIRGASAYLEPDGWPTGVTHQIGEYKVKEGAFEGDDPDMYVDENRNVVVAKAGRYAIYYAQYTNDNAEGWYSVYVGRHELTISNTSPKLQVGKSTVLEAHNWVGELTYNVTSGSELITVERNDYQFTLTAGATAGTATIVFTDEIKSVTVTVTISQAPVSFKAKIHLDKSYFANWDPAASEFSLYVWDDDGNKPLGDWNECKGNLDSGTLVLEHDRTINHFIFFFNQGGQTKQSIDLYCSIDDEYSDYYITVSSMGWKDGQMTGIVISGGQPVIPEEYYYKFYVKGIGGDWTAQEQYLLNQDTEEINHLYLNHVALTALDEIKVYLATDDPYYMNESDRWFGVASAGDHYTVGSDNNLVVSETGTYTIDFYEVADNGNHIQLYSESTPEPQTYTYKYYLRGVGGDWETNNFELVATSDANRFRYEKLTLAENGEIKVYVDTEDPAYASNHWLGVPSTYVSDYATGTADGNLKVKATNEYNVDFYVQANDGVHIVITPVNVPVTPVPETQTISVKASVAQTDGAWIALWAWKDGNNGKFYFAKTSGYGNEGTWVFELPEDVDRMIVLRMASGAEVTDVNNFPDGKVWNQTGTIEITGTVYEITSIMEGKWE